MTDWTPRNIYFLGLITAGYVVGEIAHFLIATTSKDVAQDVHYGDQTCQPGSNATTAQCEVWESETACQASGRCEWKYNGQGTQFQLLVGPAFIYTFSGAALTLGLLLDRFNRPLLLGVGILLFSASCVLMGVASQFWQLILLRVGVALGEAVCRPAASSLIAEIFSPASRGVANGIFSWGVYFGYGMAYIFGIYLTKADVLGHGWRASYVIGGLPGIGLGLAVLVTVRDPGRGQAAGQGEQQQAERSYLADLRDAFLQPAMFLLLLSASVRQLAGLSWANNNVNYFQQYYPDQEVGFYWLTVCSILGGSVGVVSGGFITDRLQARLGLHSRLWVQSGITYQHP